MSHLAKSLDTLGVLGRSPEIYCKVYRKIIYWESYRDLGAPFLKAYSEANNGRLPLVNNNIKAAWEAVTRGDITESMYQEALSQRDELKYWVSKYLTEDSSPSVTLLVKQSSKHGEELRDTQSDERYFAPSKPGQVLLFVHLSTLADLTDHHVPIGQFECLSSATGLRETYPLTASITMASGGESALLRLIRHLHHDGVLDSVKTGRTAF
ncbi:hypothetical protein FJTKL_04788 [Diaporthe vaccinii]|uniref:Uncharacterized protein n=1 Tax=Diaporthe vaccinii TaxID=105482 RepID=A0ABR4DSI2_9PEZI